MTTTITKEDLSMCAAHGLSGEVLHWQPHDMADCVLGVHNQAQPLSELMLPWFA